MKALVISHTPHYKKEDQLVGWGPTVREIDALSTLFEKLTHVAPLHHGRITDSNLKYESKNIVFIPVSPAGGETLWAKCRLLAAMPQYIFILVREIKKADVVHVRCPSNIGFLAVILLGFFRKPKLRWIKYAGNWSSESGDSFSCKIQRWWLQRNFARSLITVNGEWPHQPRHIHSFLNPSLSAPELLKAQTASQKKELAQPLKLLYAGWLNESKGAHVVLRIFYLLKQKGVTAHLDFAGGGRRQHRFVRMAKKLKINDQVQFHGWVSRTDIDQFYEKAHFLILPSSSEGWPKVISEAMAYGTVPLASNVSCIPQYLKKFRTGQTFAAKDAEAFVNAILRYLENPERWKEESQNAAKNAVNFTYEEYLSAVKKLLAL